MIVSARFCRLTSSILTSSGAARYLERIGISVQEIERLGGWTTQDSLRGAYLTGHPVRAIRALADHPVEGGRYYIARAEVEPPRELLNKVFPELGKWLNGGSERSKIGPYNDTKDFLELLAYLRVVLLQDAAMLLLDSEHHWVLKQPLFQSQEFREFAAEVKLRLPSEQSESEQRSLSSAIARIAPDLHDRFTQHDNRLDSGLRRLGQQIQSGAALTSQRLDRSEATVDAINTSFELWHVQQAQQFSQQQHTQLLILSMQQHVARLQTCRSEEERQRLNQNHITELSNLYASFREFKSAFRSHWTPCSLLHLCVLFISHRSLGLDSNSPYFNNSVQQPF